MDKGSDVPERVTQEIINGRYHTRSSGQGEVSGAVSEISVYRQVLAHKTEEAKDQSMEIVEVAIRLDQEDEGMHLIVRVIILDKPIAAHKIVESEGL